MRAITKDREPPSLGRHRAASHSDYANYPFKDDLRASLVKEQRGICCYCMARISADAAAMKIEHWRCQSRYPDLGLAYGNLLAACRGGEDQPEDLHHCDTRKGDRDLQFNPANPEHRINQRIRFELDGTIASSDEEFDLQLNDVLGLNLPLLKNRRKSVLAGLLEWWRSEKARLHGPVPRERLERKLARCLGQSKEILDPSDPVAAWWLEEKLTKSAS